MFLALRLGLGSMTLTCTIVVPLALLYSPYPRLLVIRHLTSITNHLPEHL
jgi:hypothetical protein